MWNVYIYICGVWIYIYIDIYIYTYGIHQINNIYNPHDTKVIMPPVFIGSNALLAGTSSAMMRERGKSLWRR